MKRLLAYSHDTYGLGNIRRMLAVCNHMIETIPDLSILMVTGSPMVHNFRVKNGIDYIKLPCLSRTEAEGYAVKSIDADLDETVRLRSDLILQTVASFKPDLILVDKKPYGVEQELRGTLNYVQTHLPETKCALLLRDVLDGAESTVKVWKKHGYYESLRLFYDLVLVVGTRAIFDTTKEYSFPPAVADKVRFCGYIKKETEVQHRDALRKELKLHTKKLVLVTVGGGEDGYHLLATYLAGLAAQPALEPFDSVLVCGPEMPPSQRTKIYQAAARHPHVQVREFVDDMPGYMDAADLVVSMGGYNTLCELLSLQKRAVVVPRVQPVEEQWIRAQRMAEIGLFGVIHPDVLTPAKLMRAVSENLHAANGLGDSQPRLDLDALPRITNYVAGLLGDEIGENSIKTNYVRIPKVSRLLDRRMGGNRVGGSSVQEDNLRVAGY